MRRTFAFSPARATGRDTPSTDVAARHAFTTVRPALRAFWPLAVLTLAVLAGHRLLGVGGPRIDAFLQDWVYNGLVLGSAGLCLLRAALVSEERPAWLALGLGLVAWAAGELYYTVVLQYLDAPPYPSPSDAGYLLFYPAAYVTLALLVRARVRRFSAGLWIDGLVAGLAVGALGTALFYQPLAATAGGDPLALATDLAYPLFDVVLVGFTLGAFALTGWRPGRAWLFIGSGFITAGVADGLFLYGTAKGTYVEGSPIDALWPAATLLLAYAAWQPVQRTAPARLDGWPLLLLPATFALTSIELLVLDHFQPVGTPAVILATGTLLVAILRMASTFAESLRIMERSRHEALTDHLTGLGNRRSLLEDLEDLLASGAASPSRHLMLFDLDGFKRYNDTFGHPAGDVLLAELGRRLGAAIGPFGTVYRLGGDEFCALLDPADREPEVTTALAMDALTIAGEGFAVGTSYGSVAMPSEATVPAAALKIADQRLYAHKADGRRVSADRQTRDVLLQALREREPDLHHHVSSVAELASRVARRMDLSAEQRDEVARAAELHDIGKVAVPDCVLSKPGPLDGDEWRLMRRHSVAGERILTAAPALLPVAKLVRSSHERWDGGGYPDGLAGEEIPLGARIVAVCDAFHAMTTNRSYRAAVTPEAALQELRRCAGTQFCASSVAAFGAVFDAVSREPGGEPREPGSAGAAVA